MANLWNIPDNIIPLVYLVAAAAIAGGLMKLDVPPEMIGLIVGAALTRVKVSSSTVVVKNENGKPVVTAPTTVPE